MPSPDPYREPPASPAAARAAAPPLPAREEVVAYALVLGAGVLPVAGGVAAHAFGTAATLGGIMCAVGAVGLGRAARQAWRHRAWTRDARALRNACAR